MESEGGTRSSLRLSLRQEGDQVQGEFGFEQGNEHVVEYLARSGNEYHLGYLNRMRPRGMLMYEGRVVEGVFSGEVVLRGVVFRFPDGREIPRTVFRLVLDE